jgi:peptidoglycan hydrolase-like protein with peptidoglycan-binding domain
VALLLPAQAHAVSTLPPPAIPPPIKLPQDSPAGTPFEGDGMWIWYASRSSGGSPDAIAARAQASGIETVFLKSSDGPNYWSQFNSAYVSALKARGLRVCGWQYVYGRLPVSEARAGRRAIQNGADCLVIDAEIEYEGRYAQASTYMSKLRAYAGPDYPIGLAGWPYVDYHPAYPFSVFLGPGGAQFNLPQMYWKAIGVSVDAVFARTYLYNQLYGRPIAPLGQTYQRPTRAELLRFRQLAAAYGAPGVSWWSWQETSTGAWAALARQLNPLGAAVAPGPVTPTLRRGARGDVVVWAQQHLLAAAQPVRVNGRYDSRTVRAVRAYQLAATLPVTGELDAPTWQSLLALPPAKVRWQAGRSTASTARTGPPSARLRARAREIPSQPH